MSFDLLGSLSRDENQPTAASDHPGGAGGPQEVQCSRRGCREPAVWKLAWNNPKVHTPERRKVWTACDEHRDHLAEFLRLRGFLIEVVPLEPPR